MTRSICAPYYPLSSPKPPPTLQIVNNSPVPGTLNQAHLPEAAIPPRAILPQVSYYVPVRSTSVAIATLNMIQLVQLASWLHLNGALKKPSGKAGRWPNEEAIIKFITSLGARQAAKSVYINCPFPGYQAGRAPTIILTTTRVLQGGPSTGSTRCSWSYSITRL